jgi:hypothetical protein
LWFYLDIIGLGIYLNKSLKCVGKLFSSTDISRMIFGQRRFERSNRPPFPIPFICGFYKIFANKIGGSGPAINAKRLPLYQEFK